MILKNSANERKKRANFIAFNPLWLRKKCWTKVENGQTITVDGYEVIDGQQRLTTLYILLKCVEQVREVLYDMFDMYSIKYETRLEFDSQQFLENINNSTEDANSFIDFYYMKTVYEAMAAWMKENKDYRNKIVHSLLEQDF